MRRATFRIVPILAAVALAFVGATGAVAGEHKDKSDAPMASAEKPAVGTKAVCPVSKKEFTVKESTEHSEHKGKHYAFCCEGCKPKFDADPEKYLGDAKGMKGDTMSSQTSHTHHDGHDRL